MKSSRKYLWIGSLVLLGLLGGSIVGGVLIVRGVVQFEWSEELLNRVRLHEAREKPRRLMILGDSFLTWWPVEHCLHRDLQRFCEEQEIGFLNTAVGGFGPYEYLDQLRLHEADFKPDLVLLFYYAGNDLTDVMYRADATPRRPEGLAPAVARPKSHAAPEAEKEAGLLRNRIESFPHRLNPAAAMLKFTATITPSSSEPQPEANDSRFDWDAMLQAGIDPDLIERAKNRLRHQNVVGPQYVNPYLLNQALHHPNYLVDNLLMDSPESEAAWLEVEGQLEKIAGEAGALKSDLCVIVIPSALQVSRSHYDFYRRAGFKMDERLLQSTDRRTAFAPSAGSKKSLSSTCFRPSAPTPKKKSYTGKTTIT